MNVLKIIRYFVVSRLIKLFVICFVGIWTTVSAAHAATAVFPDSAVFGNAANNDSVLGAPDGNGATFGAGSFALYDYGTDITGQDITFYATNATGGTSWLFIVLYNSATGNYVFPDGNFTSPTGNATAFFYVQVQNGAFAIPNNVFASACASAGGCTGVYVGRSIFSDAGASFDLDSVGATPEPTTWALMIMGFCLTAWQIKKRKADNLTVAMMPAKHA